MSTPPIIATTLFPEFGDPRDQAQLGEGPVWDHRTSTLYWVDIGRSLLLSCQIDADSNVVNGRTKLNRRRRTKSSDGDTSDANGAPADAARRSLRRANDESSLPHPAATSNGDTNDPISPKRRDGCANTDHAQRKVSSGSDASAATADMRSESDGHGDVPEPVAIQSVHEEANIVTVSCVAQPIIPLPGEVVAFVALTVDPRTVVCGGRNGLFLVDVLRGEKIHDARDQAGDCGADANTGKKQGDQTPKKTRAAVWPERAKETHRFNDGKVDPTGQWLFAGTMQMKEKASDIRIVGGARLYQISRAFEDATIHMVSAMSTQDPHAPLPPVVPHQTQSDVQASKGRTRGAAVVVDTIGPVTVSNGLTWWSEDLATLERARVGKRPKMPMAIGPHRLTTCDGFHHRDGIQAEPGVNLAPALPKCTSCFFYYIDTPSKTIVRTTYDMATGHVSKKIALVRCEHDPDGMTASVEGELFVAQLRAGEIRRFCCTTGHCTGVIKVGDVRNGRPLCNSVTSCCFAGPQLDMLVITTGLGTTPDAAKNTLAVDPRGPSGRLFSIKVPGATGFHTPLFSGPLHPDPRPVVPASKL